MLEGVVKLKVFVLNDSIFTDIMHYKRLFTFGSDRIDRKTELTRSLNRTEPNANTAKPNRTGPKYFYRTETEPKRIIQ